MVLGLEVDAGQSGSLSNPSEQPETRGAAARADFHDGLRADRGREKPQHHAGQRRDGDRTANSLGVGARRQQRFVLGDEFIDDACDV
jgi:hypothetical protein